MEKTNFLYYDRLMIEYKETKHSLVYKANSDLSLYSAGYEECTPGYSYGPTLRSYQLIHFVLNGEGVFRINEHVFYLKAGDAFLIPAGKITYYEASKNKPLVLCMDQLYRHQLGKLSLSDYDFNRRYLCDPWSGYPKILRFYFQDHAIRRLIDQSLF